MKILVAGDYCPIERVSKLINNGDFSSVFLDVQRITKNVDYAIVNFECPVILGAAAPIDKNGPNLCCTFKGVEALKWAGFQCVTLANNHFFDYGPLGVKETLRALDSLDIDHVGGGINISEAESTLYKRFDHEVLAIINCCEHEFSIATDKTAGSNPLNLVRQYRAIREAKERADYVLIIIHGGHEHFQLPSPRMQETYRFFIEAGADAVVNHHQHCFSGYEVYNGKPIFYGLGNFCFDNKNYRDGKWTKGYFVDLDFSNREIKFSLHPYTQCSKEPRVMIMPENAFDDELKKLNAIIGSPDVLKSNVEKYYEESAVYYGSIFEPMYNKAYLFARYRGWLPSLISKKKVLAAMNFVECEAHRDKLIWWLEHNK